MTSDLQTIFKCPVPQDVQEWHDRFVAFYGDVVPTGSRVIGGYTDKSDYDFAVNVPEGMLGGRPYSILWETPGTEKVSYTNPKIHVYRWGVVNLIVDTRESGILDNWRKATAACIDRQPEGKAMRIKVFEEFGT